jgi:hypothetical protein
MLSVRAEPDTTVTGVLREPDLQPTCGRVNVAWDTLANVVDAAIRMLPRTRHSQDYVYRLCVPEETAKTPAMSGKPAKSA